MTRRGVLRVMCPSGETGAGLAPACWPDQKPVRPSGGVTRHSRAARGFPPQTDTGVGPPTEAGGGLDACRSGGLCRRCRPTPRQSCARDRACAQWRGRLRDDDCRIDSGLRGGVAIRRGARSGPARVRCRGKRLLRCGSDALLDRPWRAGTRGEQIAARASLRGQDRCARRGPRRPQRARPRAAGDASRRRRTSGPTGVGCGTGRSRQREVRRTRSDTRPVDHNPRTAAPGAAPADAGSTTAPPGSHSTRRETRSRAAWEHARPTLGRSTRAAATSRRTRARTPDRGSYAQTRAAAPRPARRWTARRRPARALLVTPWPHPIGSSLRTARRRRPDPSLIRTDRPIPARPKRRPQTEPRTAHDPRHPETRTPANNRLHPTTHARRQNTTRSQPLPQALPRPQPLPPTRTRTATDNLTDIEASVAHLTDCPDSDGTAGTAKPGVGWATSLAIRRFPAQGYSTRWGAAAAAVS